MVGATFPHLCLKFGALGARDVCYLSVLLRFSVEISNNVDSFNANDIFQRKGARPDCGSYLTELMGLTHKHAWNWENGHSRAVNHSSGSHQLN
jgi:hypothetical protein